MQRRRRPSSRTDVATWEGVACCNGARDDPRHNLARAPQLRRMRCTWETKRPDGRTATSLCRTLPSVINATTGAMDIIWCGIEKSFLFFSRYSTQSLGRNAFLLSVLDSIVRTDPCSTTIPVHAMDIIHALHSIVTASASVSVQ